jgi:hypothetical protein
MRLQTVGGEVCLKAMASAERTGIREASGAPPGTCWKCSAVVGEGHFCAQCGAIQPLARGTDYFRFFGLPRKLWIEMGDLEARFHELSWKLHPDNFVRASAEEREMSLERSSQLNDAYRVLRDPLARVEGSSSMLCFETDIFPKLTIREDHPGLYATAYGMLADFVRAVGGISQGE